MKNEFILDGKIQKDIKRFSNSLSFNISAITGKFLLNDNSFRNRYTYIRVIYTGEVTEELNNIVQPDCFVRLYGKLDSEQYVAKSQKIVYNKILRVHKITKLCYDKEERTYKEIIT